MRTHELQTSGIGSGDSSNARVMSGHGIAYRREIDGLRAVAVATVVLFHAGFESFSGGYIGVDVFFVISGYLITSIIISDLASDRFSLGNFYERRVRRILPALFFVMIVSTVLAWILMRPSDMRDYAVSLAAATISASNIYFARTTGYFDPSGDLRPLLHTWSLGVEEQYYLFFPFFLLLVYRYVRSAIFICLAVCAVASLVLAQLLVTKHPSWAFFLLPTRGWQLLIGAMLAVGQAQLDRVNASYPRGLREIAGMLGLALIVLATFTFKQDTKVPGVIALVPTLGAALIIAFATKGVLIGRLLGHPVLVGAGLLSYSIYLWHQPLLAFTRYYAGRDISVPTILTVLAGTLVLSWLSWKYIEIPFRDRRRLSRKTVFGLTGACVVGLFAFGWAGRSDGFEYIYYNYRLNEAQRQLHDLIRAHTGGDLYSEMVDNRDCNFWDKEPTEAFVKRFQACAQKYGPATIVLGDSHAMNIYNALARANFAPFLVGLSQGGCRPHDDSERCHYQATRSFISSNRAHVQVVYYHQSGGYLMRERSNTAEASPDTVAINYERIEKVAKYLSELSEMTKVVWIGPFVEAQIRFNRIEKLLFNGLRIDGRVIRMFAILDERMKNYLPPKRIEYVSLVDVLAIDPEFIVIGDCLTFRDYDHFSICGEKIVGQKLSDVLRSRDRKTGSLGN